jgi:hypothetical protein
VTLYRSEARAVQNVRQTRADKTLLLGSELQSWSEEDILNTCRSPALRHSCDRWLKLAKKGTTPLLKDMYGNEEEARLDDSMLLLQQESDFLYVHQGSTSVQKYGKCFRGILLSKISGNMTTSFLNFYNGVIRELRPKYVQFRADFSARHVRWERVVLPLISDEKGSSKFLMTYSEPLDDRLDILTATFDKSPIGMIAAAKAVGENRSLDEAEILLINARARSMLKLTDAGIAVRTVAELRSWIRDVVGWEQAGDGNASASRTKLLFRGSGGTKKISVIVEPHEYFVVYHLIEM